MVKTVISPSDLEHNTREIVDRVRHGELAVIESAGEEQAVLLDATDFRLLQALAANAAGLSEEGSDAQVIREYLDERISFSKAAEKLGLSRFELQERFHRLGAPLRLGPASIEEAQAEIAVLRRHLGDEGQRQGEAS
jgi:prevent-host-death family protein